jgi:hypothetical protein
MSKARIQLDLSGAVADHKIAKRFYGLKNSIKDNNIFYLSSGLNFAPP